MDQGEVTALTLLDLSAAFDTIAHATLTNRLSDWYGISGQVQIRFSSYLQNRHQSVKIEDILSDQVTLSYGVPQGSVLGPVLFTLYMHYTTQRYHLQFWKNTIFMPMILIFTCSKAMESLENLQHCVMDVSAWMVGSELKLNPSKT